MGLSRIFYFFGPYTDGRERAAGLFFKHLDERHRAPRVRRQLGRLLQRDVAAINLWTEYRYKGYKYLNKRTRRQLYANLQLIADDFDRYYQQRGNLPGTAWARAVRLTPQATPDRQKLALLIALTHYFSPGEGRYEYRTSSSFGRLLRDPAREKLAGDCNQIVTLYIYVYARYYDVHDLRLRILPGHVALHYNGIDIETTNGTLVNYAKKAGSALLPVEEIVSLNLLDTTDAYLSTHGVAAADLLQAARLAYLVSHDRGVAANNLQAAYHNLVRSLMAHRDYRKAFAVAKASRDSALQAVAAHNGALYEIQHHNFAAARRYAAHASDRAQLVADSWRAEGSYQYQAGHYKDAIKAFARSGDKRLVQQGYEALFFKEQERLGKNLNAAMVKQYAPVIKRMRHYAKKSGNSKLVKRADELAAHL